MTERLQVQGSSTQSTYSEGPMSEIEAVLFIYRDPDGRKRYVEFAFDDAVENGAMALTHLPRHAESDEADEAQRREWSERVLRGAGSRFPTLVRTTSKPWAATSATVRPAENS